MKVVAIDLETTGLDPQKHQILEFGAVYYDFKTQERKSVNWIIRNGRICVGEITAIAMNARIFAELASETPAERIIQLPSLTMEFRNWLENECLYREAIEWGDSSISYCFKKDLVVVGKNVDFDLSFLKAQTDWSSEFTVHRRKLDPAILYVDWVNDEEPPNLTTCKSRAGIPGAVTHKAVDDANDVIDLLIHHVNKTKR